MNKSSLFAEMANRGLSLAAATAAATTAFAFFATAIFEHSQFIHGIHLLSNRRLSMKYGKKRDGYPVTTLITTSVAFSSGANLSMICPQQNAMRS